VSCGSDAATTSRVARSAALDRAEADPNRPGFRCALVWAPQREIEPRPTPGWFRRRE